MGVGCGERDGGFGSPDEVVHEDRVLGGVPVGVVRGVLPARLRRVEDARAQGHIRGSSSIGI